MGTEQLPAEWTDTLRQIKALRRKKEAATWEIADLMLRLVPIDMPNSPHKRYLLGLLSRGSGYSPRSVQEYRTTAASWPSHERVPGAPLRAHHRVIDMPNRREVLSEWAKAGQSMDHLWRNTREPDRQQPRRVDHQSFANISKAALAAIEVMENSDLPWDQRGPIALTILRQFFEDWSRDDAA